jgi:hypothetical protein
MKTGWHPAGPVQSIRRPVHGGHHGGRPARLFLQIWRSDGRVYSQAIPGVFVCHLPGSRSGPVTLRRGSYHQR